MTRWPPFLGLGWLLAYAASGALWLLILGPTPIALIVVVASVGALAVIALGNLLQREDR